MNPLWALVAIGAVAAPWRHPLYLANGGYWRGRVQVVVTNRGTDPLRGTPIAVRVGATPPDLGIAGAQASAIRVCNARGDEMLYEISDVDGAPIRMGAIPEGAKLTIPFECPAGAEAAYYVYFDNPNAWTPPDYLDATGELRNGSVELGEGDAPAGWTHDPADQAHVASWTSETSRSGRRALKLWVADDAEHTWIATRQTGIRLAGGGRYRLTAWVKARDVRGTAGWYIHIGNAANTMMDAPMLSAGEGSFDWKPVAIEFTAPIDADRADLGTVLRGTGTAWFDDVSLERLDAGESYEVRCAAAQHLQLREIGGRSWWKPRGPSPVRRTPVRIVNLGDAPHSGFASVDLPALLRHKHAQALRHAIRLVDGGRPVRTHTIGASLLFEVTTPPQTAQMLYAYADSGPALTAGRSGRVPGVAVEYAPNPALPAGVDRTSATAAISDYAGLLANRHNLARNSSFELADGSPAHWIGGAEGERPADARMEIVDGALFGRRCARMSIPHTSTPSWTGWRQDAKVRPGASYLYAAWVRCADLRGSIQLHAHLRTETGELVRQGAMVGAGPAITGTTGWTLLSGVFQTPDDCRVFQMHLTMLATGTVWHDGVLLLELTPAEALPMETLHAARSGSLRIWSVNPIVKVFREDTPPAGGQVVTRLTMARNEYEPLQLAIRSERDIRNVRVVVDPPRSARGRALEKAEIGVIGHVPVDQATNYYSDTLPVYYRKIPIGPRGSDGWAGWWPDPILPVDHTEVKAGVTQPIWITFFAPKASEPGEYRGAVRLVITSGSASRTIARFPFAVRVLDFDLPERPSLKAIYDCRQTGPLWRVPEQSEQQTRENFWRFMARRRVCPDTIKPEPMIAFRDERVVADFTEFDRAATLYFEELRFPHAYTPWHFYLFGWGHLPGEKFGEAPYPGQYPYAGVDRSVLRPEFRRAYQECLRTYWEHMKRKGWTDRITLYISDEPYDSDPDIRKQMSALCDMIHEVDPGIPIYCSTWHHQPDWDGKLDVWGIGHYGIVPVTKMNALRAAGSKIWWTTDGQMCTDTPYCAIERLLPHYCFKYGAEAYEFWGIDWLTYDPYRYGWHAFLPHDFGPGQQKQYVRYPNGDGFLAYPPGPLRLSRAVTSMRLEQAREGVEDYEYLVMLRRLLQKPGMPAQIAARGQRALRMADALVTSPCEIGRYSTRILPDPSKVPAVKQALGYAIEALLGAR